jgi:two-component system nitrogen regulation sensor histidine kinase NtrY
MSVPSASASERPLIVLLSRFGQLFTGRVAALALVVLAMAAGALTYAAFGGLLPMTFANRWFVGGLLAADIIIAIGLAAVVVSRVVRTLIEQRRGAAGARLHVRMVLLFGLFAVVPTFVVAMVSGYWLSIGLQEFVNERIARGMDSARLIGNTALEPQRAAVLADVERLSSALQQLGPETVGDAERSLVALSRLAPGGPTMMDALIVDSSGQVIAAVALLPGRVAPSYVPPTASLARAAAEAGPLVELRQTGVYVVLHLFTGGNLFLVSGHSVDPGLWFHVDQIARADAFLTQLENNSIDNQLRVFAVYAVIAVLMLLSAVWLALTFASRLAQPIGNLMAAADQVRKGDLSARVQEEGADGELKRLVRAFNRMTRQLDQQRRALVDANRQLDERRQLTEAILSGVSAGVLSIGISGEVLRANRSSTDLLGLPPDQIEGRRLLEVLPELGNALEQARARPDRAYQRQIEIRRDGVSRTLLVRISTELGEDGLSGNVVTFDDVSDLMAAQRMAAWADVARRIAHEIKNPLTPIQLSAERLKRKYLRQITDDPDTFTICTDTIVRQVGDIGRMVDEFSSFARMPRPTLASEDLKEICQQALFLQRNAQPQIEFIAELPDTPPIVVCDRRQIGQALTNLLKNAGEAIEGRAPPPDGGKLPPGQIRLRLLDRGGETCVVIEDNGKGLPREGRERLTEPYVTTRTKGTGLGLAIVKKIMEDHGGALLLDDREGGGARISLLFQRATSQARPATAAASA